MHSNHSYSLTTTRMKHRLTDRMNGLYVILVTRLVQRVLCKSVLYVSGAGNRRFAVQTSSYCALLGLVTCMQNGRDHEFLSLFLAHYAEHDLVVADRSGISGLNGRVA
jgi:hypothetical protein